MKNALILGVLDLIREDRLLQSGNSSLIARLVHVILALNFYKGDFEKRFLEQSTHFFREESLKNIHQLDVRVFYFTTQHIAFVLHRLHRRDDSQGDAEGPRMP